MNRGEFYFAFDAQGNLDIGDIIIPQNPRYFRPAFPSDKIKFKDSGIYQALKDRWNNMIKNWKNDLLLMQVHRYTSLNDWHNLLKILLLLDEIKSSFQRIGL